MISLPIKNCNMQSDLKSSFRSSSRSLILKLIPLGVCLLILIGGIVRRAEADELLPGELPPPVMDNQLDERCTASALNRTTTVSPNGTFSLSNIPADTGLVKVRIICERDGSLLGAASELLTIGANETVAIGVFNLGEVPLIAESLSMTSLKTTLSTLNETAQLTVAAVFDDGTLADVTNAPDTVYTATMRI